MYDYLKLWIEEAGQIERVCLNPLLQFRQEVNVDTGEPVEYPQTAKWKEWTVTQKSATRLEIAGSIHKFWNDGRNENDFAYTDAVRAIDGFCQTFRLTPSLARVVNLEFAVNIKPLYPATELLDQIICYNNLPPLKNQLPKDGFRFIEFRQDEYYVKVYDKGEQSRNLWRFDAGNIFRFEIKAKTNNYLSFAGIKTLADLKKREVFRLLGERLVSAFDNLVFTDDTIEPEKLSTWERKNYMQMKDAKEWTGCKKKKTSTHRDREAKFKEIVKEQGKRNIYIMLRTLIAVKVKELIENKTPLVFVSKYTPKTNGVTNNKQEKGWPAFADFPFSNSHQLSPTRSKEICLG